jgi:ribulose bisphosphate carboxylase small subunit
MANREETIKKLENFMHNFNQEYIQMISNDQLKILFQQVVNELNKRKIT